MPVLVSPGVYTQVLDFSQYVTNLTQTIFCVIGGFHKGPVNTPTIITNAADRVRVFGVADDDTFAPLALDKFLEKGRQSVVVRVADSSVATATQSIDGLAQPPVFLSSIDMSYGVDLTSLQWVEIAISPATTKEIDLTVGWAGDITKVSIDHIISRLNHVSDGIPGFASKNNTN